MLTELDLGCIELQSAASKLEVHLRSSATFAPSEEGDIDRLKTILTAFKLNAKRSQLPWISKGNSFKLVLKLELSNRLDRTAQDILVETLADQLRDAKLWEQLYFAAPSVQTSSAATPDCHEIEISPVHEERISDKPKRVLHKLDNGTPFCDVKPPEDVPYAFLESVHVSICVKHYAPRKRRRPRNASYIDDSRIPTTKISKSRDSHQQPGRDVCKADDDEGLLDIGIPCLDSEPAAPTLWPELENTHDDSDDANMLFESQDSLDLTHESPLAPSPLKRRLSITDLDKAANSDNVGSVIRLVDAGIRLAIAGRPKRSTNGLRVKNDNLHPLSSVAPTVWSPGHLPAVASRAIFLPTIAHALEGICVKYAQSEKLQSTASALAQHVQTHRSHPDAANSRNALFQDLSAKLWDITRAGVYYSESARSLKPLSVQTQEVPQEFLFEEESLKLSQESFEAQDIYEFEDDGDDLLDEREDEDDDMFDEDDDMFDEDDDVFDEDLLDRPDANLSLASDRTRRGLTPGAGNHGRSVEEAQALERRGVNIEDPDPTLWSHDVAAVATMRTEDGFDEECEDLLSVCSSLESLCLPPQYGHATEDLVQDFGTPEMLGI